MQCIIPNRNIYMGYLDIGITKLIQLNPLLPEPFFQSNFLDKAKDRLSSSTDS